MGERIRVAMVCGPARPDQDGVSDYVSRLVEALSEVDVQVWPVPVRRAAADRPGWWPAVRRAARTVRALRPDLVHVQFAPAAYRFSGLPGLLPLLLPAGTPLVTTVHEYGWWATPGWLPSAVWRPLERAGWWDRETGRLVPASATVLTTNHGHAVQVRHRTGRQPAEVPLAPNVTAPEVAPEGTATRAAAPRVAMAPAMTSGVAPTGAGAGDTGLNGAAPGDTDLNGAGPPTGGHRIGARQRWGLPGDGPVLAFFGFVHPVKGLRYLIEALADLRRPWPEAHLLVVGGFTSQALPEPEAAAFRGELSTHARQLGVADAVTFTGHLPADQVADALTAADLAVLPFTEGVSTKSGALLTVWAHGLPAAVTVGEPPDPRLRDGETVAVIPARRDRRAVADTVARLLSDDRLRHRLAEAGPRLVGDRTWPQVAAAHRRVYEEALTGG